MTVTDDVEQIGLWASRSDPAERERLLAALGDLADTERLEASPRAQAVIGEILTSLAAHGGPELRRKVAEWAARGRCTPHGLALDLAFDGIDVSGVVIRRSPALGAEDLLRLVAEGAPDHQIAVGRRAALAASVVEAILEQGEPAALAALADNPAAPLARAHLDLLVGMAKRLPALRLPLARHPGLDEELADRLRECSGPVVRRVLAARFGDHGHITPAAGVPDGCERRLTAKLQAAGRLSPGYALRVLREGKLGLFEHAVATLADLPHQQVREALEADSPEPAAKVCAAAGMDRLVAPLVLEKLRQINGGRPGHAAPAPKVRKPRAAKPEAATAAKSARARSAGGRATSTAKRRVRRPRDG